MNNIDRSISPNSSIFHDTLDIKSLLNILHHHIWYIIGFSFFTMFTAFLYTFTIHPLYESSALIQITSNGDNGVFSKLPIKSNSGSGSNTQEALIKTRYILEPVIIQNALNVSVSLNYFPYIGKILAKFHQDENLASPLFGLTSYAWGGEKVIIKSFQVPENYVNKSFSVVVGKNETYQVFLPDGKLLLTGTVGNHIEINNISLEISELYANPGTKFNLTYKFPYQATSQLARKLKIIPVLGHDPLQETGIFQLTLTDSDPNAASTLLNAIIKYAVAKNALLKTQETQNTLNFLNKKLPELKRNLARAEDALNQFHMNSHTLSMSSVSQLLLRQLTTEQQALEKLTAEKQELLQTYTPKHPIIMAANQKEALLKSQIDNIIKKISKFPPKNQQELDLLRETKIKSANYMAILNNQQQVEIVKAGLKTDIIGLTDATPADKLPTHKLLLIIGGFFIGFFSSTILIILKNSFHKSFEDANQIEEQLNIPVQVVLPFSRKQKQLQKVHDKSLNTFGTGLSAPLILAKYEPDDITVENLRSLRISMHILSPKPTDNVVALMGSLANIGKSFISLNFAQVLADSGKRTLLIDADLRNGLLHQSLHQPKSNGLSEYIEGKCTFENLIRHINGNLYYISCGKYTTHPVQIFQNSKFTNLITKIKQEFDHVIIDTPPILSVIDSVLVAKQCDIKLFVIGAGKDSIDEVKKAVKKARAHQIEIDGIVLNHLKPDITKIAKYYYRYGNIEETV